jgi:hypothetical protein
MPPLALNDEEMAAVMDAATPLAPSQRDAFLRDVAAELAKCPHALGPGSVYRTAREVQRRYFTPLRTWDAVGKRL